MQSYIVNINIFNILKWKQIGRDLMNAMKSKSRFRREKEPLPDMKGVFEIP